MPALICLCSSRKPNPQCPLAAHQASARAKLQDSERKRAKPADGCVCRPGRYKAGCSVRQHAVWAVEREERKGLERAKPLGPSHPLASAMHPDNVGGVKAARAAAEDTLADLNKPKPRTILSEGMKLGKPVDATKAQCGHEWAGVAGEKLEPSWVCGKHITDGRTRTIGNHRCTLMASFCTAGLHLCNCGATKTTLAPKPAGFLSFNNLDIPVASHTKPAAYGHQRMQVEEAATSQLQGGDKDARDGWAKDLGDAGIPPFVELDAAGREAMALECERMAAQLRHVEAGQRMWAAHKHNAPLVWTGMVDGWVTHAPGPVVNVLVSLVVASTFKVGP